MGDENELLRVENLKVHFPVYKGILLRRRIGYVRAVDDVSFGVFKGEALGLVGESGCGKSTTAMAISQLQPATSGRVVFGGKELQSLSPDELRRERMNFQIVFQDPYSSLDPRMRAGDIIAEPLRIYSKNGILKIPEKEIEERTRLLMNKVGLATNFYGRYPHEFSGGQRQRIGIARALALNPKMIIADEPVSALDVSIQSQILNLLKDLQEEFGLTYLFIAHNLAVVEYFCSRIVVMYLGTVVEIASSATLYSNPLHPYTKALLSAVPVPDPQVERKRRRTILKGDVPSPMRERSGCPFVDRCPQAMEKCRKEVPALTEVSSDEGGLTPRSHRVACFLYENHA